jgi:uncharacterized protein (DUF58 family)
MTASKTYLHPEVLGRIGRLELRARSVVEGFINGLHTSPYHGLAVEFAEHREYAPGDDVRHIDWRLYAKSDRYYIKQYEEETNLRCHILVDSSASMAYPTDAPADRMTKWDTAATLAASIAMLQLHQQDAVGLTLFDSGIRAELPNAASARQLGDIVTVLENHPPRDHTDVSALFGTLVERVRRRSMVVLISDLLADIDDLMLGLGRLRHSAHDVLVLHVMDHDELEFPFAEQTLFEGMEAPQELRTDPQALRRSYLEKLNAFLGQIRGFCMDQRIDYQLFSTQESLAVGLSAFLAARMHAITANVR